MVQIRTYLPPLNKYILWIFLSRFFQYSERGIQAKQFVAQKIESVNYQFHINGLMKKRYQDSGIVIICVQ